MATAKELVIIELKAQGSKQTAEELSRTADRVLEMKDEVRKLNSEINKLIPTQRNHNDRLRNSNGNYKENAKGMRMMRGGAAQFGYQMQDIAVQAQMGTHATMIFAQQGSQIASLFGPGGAALGAVIAVGGALASVAMKSNEAAKATKNLSATLKDLGKDYKDLTDSQREYLINQEKIAIKAEESTQSALMEEKASLQGIIDTYNKLTSITDPVIRAQAQASITFLENSYNIKESEARLLELNAALDTSQDAIRSHRSEIDALNGVYMATEEGIKNYYDSLLTLNDAQKQGTAERVEREKEAFGIFLDNLAAEVAAIDARNAAEQKAAEEKIATEQMLYDTFKGFDEKRAEDEQAALDRFFDNFAEETRMMEERNARIKQLNDGALQSYGAMFGGIGDMMKDGSRAQQAAFAVQKGIAVAQAVMNLHKAVSEANTLPFPANFAAIAQAVATGTAAIAGVKSASFEGGGFTGMGTRSGGIDGKGGFPAILHPNETIIDHTKGQSGRPVTVNFNITANDTSGFDQLLQSRRGQIIGMINQAVNNRGRPSVA